MRPLKKFEEFLKLGVVNKRPPNKPRAESLIDEASKRKAFLEELKNKIGLSDENANYFIENCYDALIESIRANLLIRGFCADGQAAHEAEISFMLNVGFSENETRFMNELRYFRNGILYYGKRFNSEYASKVLDFLGRVYSKLIELFKKIK